jgi:hypothetical protein
MGVLGPMLLFVIEGTYVATFSVCMYPLTYPHTTRINRLDPVKQPKLMN